MIMWCNLVQLLLIPINTDLSRDIPILTQDFPPIFIVSDFTGILPGIFMFFHKNI